MALTIVDNGSRNIVKSGDDVGTGTVVFEGNDNVVELGPGVRLDGGAVRFGSSCRLRVAADCMPRHIDVFGIVGAVITTGNGSNFTWASRIYAHELGNITIGRGVSLPLNSDALSDPDMIA